MVNVSNVSQPWGQYWVSVDNSSLLVLDADRQDYIIHAVIDFPVTGQPNMTLVQPSIILIDKQL